MLQTTLIRIRRLKLLGFLTYLAAVCFEFRASNFEFNFHWLLVYFEIRISDFVSNTRKMI